jgi:hypothetical protein
MVNPSHPHHPTVQRLGTTTDHHCELLVSSLQILLAHSPCNRFLAVSLDVSGTIECRWVSGDGTTSNATNRTTRQFIATQHRRAPRTIDPVDDTILRASDHDFTTVSTWVIDNTLAGRSERLLIDHSHHTFTHAILSTFAFQCLIRWNN